MLTFPIRAFVVTIFYIRALYYMKICIQTLAYELSLMFFCQTNFTRNEHLRMNFLLMKNCIQIFPYKLYLYDLLS